MTKQYGFTKPGPTPGYVNVKPTGDGKMRVTVRSDGDGNTTGVTAFIDLDPEDYVKLHEAMLDMLEP